MLTVPELNVQMEWSPQGGGGFPLPTDPDPSRTFKLHIYASPTCIQVRAVHKGQALVCLHKLLCVYVCVSQTRISQSSVPAAPGCLFLLTTCYLAVLSKCGSHCHHLQLLASFVDHKCWVHLQFSPPEPHLQSRVCVINNQENTKP